MKFASNSHRVRARFYSRIRAVKFTLPSHRVRASAKVYAARVGGQIAGIPQAPTVGGRIGGEKRGWVECVGAGSGVFATFTIDLGRRALWGSDGIKPVERRQRRIGGDKSGRGGRVVVFGGSVLIAFAGDFGGKGLCSSEHGFIGGGFWRIKLRSYGDLCAWLDRLCWAEFGGMGWVGLGRLRCVGP